MPLWRLLATDLTKLEGFLAPAILAQIFENSLKIFHWGFWFCVLSICQYPTRTKWTLRKIHVQVNLRRGQRVVRLLTKKCWHKLLLSHRVNAPKAVKSWFSLFFFFCCAFFLSFKCKRVGSDAGRSARGRSAWFQSGAEEARKPTNNTNGDEGPKSSFL